LVIRYINTPARIDLIFSPLKNREASFFFVRRFLLFSVNLKPVGYARRREDSKETRHRAAAETV
jgi:hypothetical protein